MAKTATQNCDATLNIGTKSIGGKTGNNHGHAEMDALHNFIFDDPWSKNNVPDAKKALVAKLMDNGVPKVVYCPSRPCCKKCSAVLSTLGFGVGPNSSFSSDYNADKMTEWGVSMRVGEVLADCGVDVTAIKNL